MPEGVHGLPRYEGTLRRRPAFLIIAAAEVRRAVDHTWTRFALMLAFAFSIVYLGGLWTLKQSRGDSIHTLDNFLYFLTGDSLVLQGLIPRLLPLLLAAAAAGPALLEDMRRGALELYFSRAVTRADYLLGKCLAVLGLVFVAIAGPSLVYWAGAFLLFDNHPDNWAWVPLGVLGYAAILAIILAGLGLGLSCVMRSSRAATLVLFGGLASIDVVLANLLEAITRSDALQVLSPFSALEQQSAWLFPGAEAPHTFPYWWGLIFLGGLAVVGWTLVALRHPRLQGVD